MPGDPWQQFATLRAYYGFMWAYPGKKLLFMGQEFGQRREWNFESGLDWNLLDAPAHRGVQAVVRDCNAGYRRHPALHDQDCDGRGLPVDRRRRFARIRSSPGCARPAAARRPSRSSTNFTEAPHAGYVIGLPRAGTLAGDPQHRLRALRRIEPGQRGRRHRARRTPSHGFACSAAIVVPPLATLWFVHEGD